MKEKGSAIYFSLVILTTIMGVILMINLVLISQLKANKEEEYSMIAYYAAESGIEEALMTVQNGITLEGGLHFEISDFAGTIDIAGGEEATYSVIITTGTKAGESGNPYCDAPYCCIRSEGEYKGVKRAIEIER